MAKTIKSYTSDKVMEEIWKTKDKLSSDYNNNLKSYLQDARKKQSKSGKIISFSNNNIKTKTAQRISV